MGLLQPEQAEEPELSTDVEADLATQQLGEPLAVFRAGGRWAKLKAIVGITLVIYGLIVNYLWWFHGPARFGHIEFHLLIAPPIIGIGLLAFLYRNRGLRILIFPTGLLRLKPNEVESFPWESITAIRFKTDTAERILEFDDNNEIINCWLPVSIPLVQVWNAWFEIERTDGEKTRFTPAVSEYTELARYVQTETFQVLWPKLIDEIETNRHVIFGDLMVKDEGLSHNGKSLTWGEIKEVTLAHKIISIKKKGSWRTWWLKEISQVPNPHLLFGWFARKGILKTEESESDNQSEDEG